MAPRVGWQAAHYWCAASQPKAARSFASASGAPRHYASVETKTDPIKDAFAPGGYIAQLRPGYEPRTGQVEMAYEVAAAMTERRHVLIEAPTGTGKSFAYGVPATHAASAGQKVVVVTANIALQEQLVGKDLPALQEALPWQFRYALAKGIGNYLCMREFDKTTNETVLTGWDGPRTEREQWNQVVRWATETTSGDISELPFEPSPKMRSKLTVLSEDCTGNRCEYHGVCHGMRARARVKEAQLAVTNYSLFYIDLQLKRQGIEGVLPDYRHVVLDEGHLAADLARSFMGFRISRWSLTTVARLLGGAPKTTKKSELPAINTALRDSIIHAADDLFAAVTQHFHSRAYKVRYHQRWEGEMQRCGKAVCGLLANASNVYKQAAGGHGIHSDRAAELHAHAARCTKYAWMIESTMACKDSNWVYYANEEGSGVSLNGAPIDVSEFLRRMLFEVPPDDDRPVHSVTVTSATLCTEHGDFEHIRAKLGIRDADGVTVESPFDLAKQAIIVCPAMPAPNSDRFIDAVAKRVQDVIEASRGRTLCLFTSYRVLNAVYTALQRTGLNMDYVILKQGTAPRTQLIAQFSADVHSVLMGTESFWAGVDVPGEALSTVVIDRLPFPNISDPVHDALKERVGSRYFAQHSIPEAMLKFRQGVGRLIRSKDDRGVVVLLDSRTTEKGYGRKFLRTFPKGVPVERDLAAVAEFLDGGE